MSLQAFLDALITFIVGISIGFLTGNFLLTAGVPLILCAPAGVVAGLIATFGAAAVIAGLNHLYEARQERRLLRVNSNSDETTSTGQGSTA